ncbi:MAG TPA: aldo/keto reductase [Acidobacteriaceae bacterium]|jgi:aryl-alcohol dehydrogenase-like predicted oxidoreductase
MSDPSALLSGNFSLGDGLQVHRLGYGTMRLVGEGAWGEPRSREDARNVLRRAVELGVTLIDTADAYGPGIAEELVAEALHPYPANLVVATKGGLTRQGPAKSKPCGRPDYLQQQLEMSLRRLRLDTIDLYQLHRIDPTVPLADTLGALKDAQTQGKIRHIGLSEVTVEQIQAAQAIVPIVSVQNRYNFTERKSEPVLHYCEQHSLAFLPWYPMNAGKIAKGATSDAPGTNHPVADFAARHDATVSQLALAWLLHHSPVILPIPGTSSIAHLEENIAAAALNIPEDDWDELELIVDSLPM